MDENFCKFLLSLQLREELDDDYCCHASFCSVVGVLVAGGWRLVGSWKKGDEIDFSSRRIFFVSCSLFAKHERKKLDNC